LKKLQLIVALVIFAFSEAWAQADTLRVMTYNVLYYGDTPPCQWPHEESHRYLKTIISYTHPDVLGLIKMSAPKQSEDDLFATAPEHFADSIIDFALNGAYPGTYSYAPITNNAHGNNVEALFYNHKKLGFACIVSSYANIVDFNTYKLYYKDANLAQTHDTIFLYVTLNHVKSGDDFVDVRGRQMKNEMAYMKQHFSSLPNMINMGDFNLRGSDEPLYQELIFPADSNFRFYDTPFFPDGKLKYPANWDDNRIAYAAYLTTSTRQDDAHPNDCGTGGGAKNWYDHIFLSGNIIHNTDHISYIPHSYRTVGNDGARYKIAVNNNNGAGNHSAPAEVIEALYRMSNKYPVMLDLLVTPNSSTHKTVSTEKTAPVYHKEEIKITAATAKDLQLRLNEGVLGEEITMEVFDGTGNSVMKKKLKAKDANQSIPCSLNSGTYKVQFCTTHNLMSKQEISIK
jgi:methionine-rich copper-binding protein CopC